MRPNALRVNRPVSIGLVALAFVAAGLAEAGAAPPADAGGPQPANAGPFPPVDTKLCLALREKWKPEDFFEQADAREACKAILERNNSELSRLIAAGLDVNQAGKQHGMTLLHWAFACDNLTAFRTLLEAGASPDRKLTETISLVSNPRWFLRGDSILFTIVGSLERRRIDFLLEALPHAKEKDPRDAAGNTLLLTCMQPSGSIFSITEETLEQIINLGVDLDAKDKDGATAAMCAIIWNRPNLALKILEAGADPTIRTGSGKTIGDLLQRRIDQEKKRGNQFYPEVSAKIFDFLEAHRQASQQ